MARSPTTMVQCRRGRSLSCSLRAGQCTQAVRIDFFFISGQSTGACSSRDRTPIAAPIMNLLFLMMSLQPNWQPCSVFRSRMGRGSSTSEAVRLAGKHGWSLSQTMNVALATLSILTLMLGLASLTIAMSSEERASSGHTRVPIVELVDDLRPGQD